jgi:hypothetical protein
VKGVFWTVLARRSGVRGVYSKEKHLHRHLADFDFRCTALGFEDVKRATKSVVGAKGKRLT